MNLHLCVCLCVCVVCYNSTGSIVHVYVQTKVCTALLRYSLDFATCGFHKTAPFRSYGIICLP